MRPTTTLLIACALVAACAVPAVTRADQPHMEAALRNLQQAHEHLRNATSDKGGHRAEALQAVDRAMAEVRRGIEYDRRHLSPNENRR
jgi:outer membrane biogenesis lipoprotein LolB